MVKGTVKFFNDSRGFGYIRLEDGREAYVHHSAIQGSGLRTLMDGEPVSMDLIEGERGLQAADVVRLSLVVG